MPGKILEGPKPKYEISYQTIGQLLFKEAEKNSDKICQVDGHTEEKETYANAKQRSTRVAIALQKRGVVAADVICFCLQNSIDTVIPIIATFYLGAIVATLDCRLSAKEMKHLLSLVLPKVIFTDEDAVLLIEECLNAINCKAEIIVHGKSKKYSVLTDLVTHQKGEDNFKPTIVDKSNIALILFSNGTTDKPKAVCHSSSTFLTNVYTHYSQSPQPSPISIHFTSFFWATAMVTLVYTYLMEGCRIFFHSYDLEQIFKITDNYKVDIFILAAPVLTYLANYENARNYNLLSVKIIQSIGSIPDPLQIEKLEEVFANARILNTYGMSEAGCISMFDPETDKNILKNKRLSCGTPHIGVFLKVVDLETNEILGPHQNGEIRVKTNALLKGYYQMDMPAVFDEDGFFKTGDLGYYDEDDCLYIVDRIKDMFKCQHFQISPSFIENIVLEHPAVKEVTVVGIPSSSNKEMVQPAACIVLKENADVTKEEIFDFAAERLSDHEKLTGGIFFVPSLPKTPAGKISRKEVRSSLLNS